MLAGGVGGSKFVLGLRAHARRTWPDGAGGTRASITVVSNTGDDVWLAGLRVCPDLDSMLYALAGVNDAERGWGRAGETDRVSAELAAYGVGWPWFTLGDLDMGTHIARTALLRDDMPLSAVTAHLALRWPLGVTLLPATDDEVPTIVETAAGDLHFEEWWVRTRATVPAIAFRQDGVGSATAAPGVLEAIAEADVVLLAPSNPVVSIGTVLGIPGIRHAVATTKAPVIGVSPIIGGAVVRGMADACLAAIGVETAAGAVAEHYGPRRTAGRPAGGLLDGWLVDTVDREVVGPLSRLGVATAAVPLWMTDESASASIAAAALDLARPSC